jgi:hypothetical protein
MRKILAAASLGAALLVSGLSAGTAQADDLSKRCTNQIDYAGDPRSNAEINSIGASTGHCPPPIRGDGR